MISSMYRMASLFGVTALVIADANTLAIMGLVVTSAAGLVAQIITGRQNDRRAERDHRYLVEDRIAAALSHAELQCSVREARESVNANVQAASDKADAAFETANHVNEKIASIAATALAVNRSTEKTSTAAIRHDIAVVRENQ